MALVIRFFGHRIGVALAITAASGVVGYQTENLVLALLAWAGIALVFSVLVSLIASIARNAVLYGVDVVEEVDDQNNIGVAAIEASISISIGLFFVALFA